MEKYQVYIVINVTLQEVYFGISQEELSEIFSTIHPAETRHWQLASHHISVPVLISKDLSYNEALAELKELEEKALANPQGKRILHNPLLDA